MPRLSDRAFQIVKNEIERRYDDSPAEQIERIILLARLQTLRARKGKPMNRVQIWEELSDIAPNFDPDVLIEAANVDTDSPIVGASIGIGAVAMLVSTAVGMETVTANATTTAPELANATENRNQDRISYDTATQNARQNKPSIVNNLTAKLTRSRSKAPSKASQDKSLSAFKAAKAFGWQAAVKGQNPPHSEQHWGQTATLWRQALIHLEQVHTQDPNYVEAQAKKATYQQNLREIEARQRSVQLANQRVSPALSELPSAVPSTTSSAEPSAVPSTAASESSPSTATSTIAQATVAPTADQVVDSKATSPQPAQAATTQSPQFSTPKEDPLKIAKAYGWQASIAGQNAPHPPEKWADISRLWQTALLNLDKIEANHPSYTEAQQVKARYQQNLSSIRQRYQLEQSATQRLQSLEATLNEIDQTLAPSTAKHSKLQAIVARLQTIPAGTQAHQQAQQLIVATNGEISAIAANNPSSTIVLSVNE